MTPSTPPGDWQVVEEALRHFKHHWLGERDPDAALARLRDREAQLEQRYSSEMSDYEKAERRAEAAEARVKELEEALRELIDSMGVELDDVRLDYVCAQVDRRALAAARRALAHQEKDMTASPFPQPALESEEKGLFRDREIPAKPADVAHEEEA